MGFISSNSVEVSKLIWKRKDRNEIEIMMIRMMTTQIDTEQKEVNV